MRTLAMLFLKKLLANKVRCNPCLYGEKIMMKEIKYFRLISFLGQTEELQFY